MVILIGLLVAGCAAPPAAPPAPTPGGKEAPKTTPTAAAKKIERIKLHTTQKVAPFMNFYLGRDKGIFKEEGLDLQIVEFKAPLATPSLLAGEADYSAPTISIFQGALAGAAVKVVMTTINKAMWHVIGAPGVETGADIKGKAVVVPSIGSGGHFATKRAMQTLGLDPDKDVTYIPISTGPEQLAALRAKSAAAASVVNPFHITAAKTFGSKELVFTGDIFQSHMDGIGTSDAKIKDNPDQVKRMIKASIKSVIFLRDNPQDSIEWLVKEVGLEKADATASYQQELKIFSFDGTTSDEGMRNTIEVAKAQQNIKGDVSLEKGFDLTLLKQAQKEMGLVK
ncbi:MAG: ABC transporter substrate-binding protein [Chloroflexi bacterium]|nr:ABC transporter substrate-binding protein [Chloroflexota bacterium]